MKRPPESSFRSSVERAVRRGLRTKARARAVPMGTRDVLSAIAAACTNAVRCISLTQSESEPCNPAGAARARGPATASRHGPTASRAITGDPPVRSGVSPTGRGAGDLARPQAKGLTKAGQTAVPTSRQGEPAWRTITIEDSSPPVGFARLDGDRTSGAFAALVRFPAGWTRPGTGRYAVDEELLVLEGEFRMSGVAYRIDDYAHLPGGYVRADSMAPRDTLVIAFFSGRADWIRLRDAEPTSLPASPIAWRKVAPRPSPVAGRARPLRAADAAATWLAHGPFEARAPHDMRIQLFSLPTRSRANVEPGGSIPTLQLPCLCRLRRGSEAGARGFAVDRDLSDV